jgi:hypothetical protein
MKSRHPLRASALALCALCTFSVSSIANVAPYRQAEIAPATTSTRIITIAPDTRSVNVTEHETVTFVAGDQRFTFTFLGADAMFSLNDVAPRGMLDHDVKVFVAPDPLYLA